MKKRKILIKQFSCDIIPPIFFNKAYLKISFLNRLFRLDFDTLNALKSEK